LGSCGWGSACLYFAEKFPKSKVTALSNSRTQKIYIDSTAKGKGLTNLTVITGNIADYEFERDCFDRVVSIEVRSVWRRKGGMTGTACVRWRWLLTWDRIPGLDV